MIRNVMTLVVVGVFSAQLSMTAGRAQEGAQQPESRRLQDVCKRVRMKESSCS